MLLRRHTEQLPVGVEKTTEGGTLKKIIAVGALGAAMGVLVFVSIALAQSPDSSGQATSAQNAPTVRIAANAFDPTQVEVASGTPLTFVNDDSVAHMVSLEGLFDTPEIPAGSSYPVTLDGTGTVTYHDKANPKMQGSIVVGGASGGETTGGETTTENPGSNPPNQATSVSP
jgi:plastocyanin